MISVTDSGLSVNCYPGLVCMCVFANGSYTMTVSITLIILYALFLDTCRFLCTSVPEQTGMFPGTLHLHFNFNSELVCVCQTKPLIHS